ncbi:MAG: EAL domain-containing protein [Cypionkella sp.]|nr:EAL domain-containing protein [Cypionkella sp.]
MVPERRKPRLDAMAGNASPLGVAISDVERTTLSMVAEAIASKRVRLAYQPVVLARDLTRVAFHEGLIRVLDPSGRVIPAKDFMSVVETHEIGRQIDSLALEKGLAALASKPDLRLSINMSARSIGYPRWKQVLRRGLIAEATVAERLILEISESSAMLVPELVIGFMEEMQRAGVAFALDDFGSGNTAIRYFKDFLFDVLKLSGQFVRNIHRDPDNQALVSALLSISKHFQMFSVAQSVETREEAVCLQDLGLDCLQGYLFGAPSLRPPWQEDQRKSG